MNCVARQTSNMVFFILHGLWPKAPLPAKFHKKDCWSAFLQIRWERFAVRAGRLERVQAAIDTETGTVDWEKLQIFITTQDDEDHIVQIVRDVDKDAVHKFTKAECALVNDESSDAPTPFEFVGPNYDAKFTFKSPAPDSSRSLIFSFMTTFGKEFSDEMAATIKEDMAEVCRRMTLAVDATGSERSQRAAASSHTNADEYDTDIEPLAKRRKGVPAPPAKGAGKGS